MEINTTQTIIIECNNPDYKTKITITESNENKDWVEISEAGEKIVFPKELVDAIVRSLAKFSH